MIFVAFCCRGRSQNRERWRAAFFATVLLGIENDNFRSDASSEASATFTNLAALIGHQWFWDNGFNLSVSYGRAVLIANETSKTIVGDESSEVVDYLEKNTKTNQHGAFGLIVGWAF